MCYVMLSMGSEYQLHWTLVLIQQFSKTLLETGTPIFPKTVGVLVVEENAFDINIT